MGALSLFRFRSLAKGASMLLLVTLGQTAVYGEASTTGGMRSSALTVGPGWTIVREQRDIPLARGVNSIQMPGIPPEAVLSGLSLHARRLPIELLSVSRTPPSTGQAEQPQFRVQGEDVYLAINERLSQAGPRGPDSVVRAVIRSPVDGLQRVDVVYPVEGLSWSVAYELGFRPSGDDPNRLSADFTGTLAFANQSSARFEQATTRMVGAGGPPPSLDPPYRSAGFLMLDSESPLADLWERKTPVPHPLYSYAAPDPITLEPYSTAQFVLVRTDRLRAYRRFRLSNERPFEGGGEAFTPFEEVIYFANTPANGMGRSLPAGPVAIQDRRLARSNLNRAWIDHHNPGDRVAVSLGASHMVRGRRQTLSREVLSPGVIEESYELVIENASDNTVYAEIEEIPPPLQWRLIRSTTPLDISPGRITLAPEIDPRSELRVQYRLQFRVPGF